MSRVNHRSALSTLAASLILTSLLSGCQTIPGLSRSTPVATPCPWTADGEGVSNNFGYSVDAAGDVDGDGYADIVIGADRYKQFTGRAYVYAGGPTGLSASPVFVATGESVNNHFGYSVAGVGDVDGDGQAEVIVGAYHQANFRGRVYVYTGGREGLTASPSLILSGEAPDHYFGRSVAMAGDVNGDGYSDVIVGAPVYDQSTGRAYVYAGGPAGLSADPVFVATGESRSDSFGLPVGTAGDVDGDGYDDIIAGAHGYDQGRGRIYVYAGGPNGLRDGPIWVATGDNPGDRFGFAAGTAGDMTGDGYAEIIVGAYGVSEGRGQIYIYAGGPTGLGAQPLLIATGEIAGDWFGRAVGTAGDVNGDGFDDAIAGAPNHEGNTGRVYVFAGSAHDLETRPILTFDGTARNSWYGYAVSTAGDVDGDGQAEVIIGAYGHHNWTGRAYVPCTPGDG